MLNNTSGIINFDNVQLAFSTNVPNNDYDDTDLIYELDFYTSASPTTTSTKHERFKGHVINRIDNDTLSIPNTNTPVFPNDMYGWLQVNVYKNNELIATSNMFAKYLLS